MGKKQFKRITKEQILGEEAIQFIGRRVLQMGYTWHPTNAPLEAGIDAFIEVRDPQTGEATNSWIAVQSKARTNLEKDSPESFEFTCTPRDLEYWNRGNMPVLLVVSRPREEEVWWVNLKEYFKADPTRLLKRRIHFDKKANALDADSAPRFLEIVQAAGSGTYFRPPPIQEQLFANLLEVTRLPKIYWAKTDFRDYKLLNTELRKDAEYPPREWILHEGLIYSVHDLRDRPWAAHCDIETVDWIEGREWANSDDMQKKRLLIWILNECLRTYASIIGMRYDIASNLLYYKKTADLSTKTKYYKGRQNKSNREVFKSYPNKADPTKIAYYRHVGFEPYLRFFDGKLYLEINPSYRFTTDGEQLHPYHQEYLSKIKSIEGSGAVGGSVAMFASLLQDRKDLFTKVYPHIGFGNLCEGEIGVGINDSLWSKSDAIKRADEPVDDDVESLPDIPEEDRPLFNEGDEGQ